MTLEEFNDQFDIRYDSIAGKSAPNIDMYEKSVYLTTAQLEIVKNRYNPSSNLKQKGFEGSEKRRVDLKELIRDFKSTSFFTNSASINDSSMFTNLPSDTFLIVNEQAKINYNNCVKTVEVIPVTHDEYNIQIKNPFKQPNERKVWRLDYSQLNNSKTIELVRKFNVQLLEYSNRYIKYPNPIILINLNQEFPEDNLTIDGQFNKSECELDESIHVEILNRAVELALGDYNPQDLNIKTQLNTREE